LKLEALTGKNLAPTVRKYLKLHRQLQPQLQPQLPPISNPPDLKDEFDGPGLGAWYSLNAIASTLSTPDYQVTREAVEKVMKLIGWYDTVDTIDSFGKKIKTFVTFPGISKNEKFDSQKENIGSKKKFVQDYPVFSAGAAQVARDLLMRLPYKGSPRREVTASPKCARFLPVGEFREWFLTWVIEEKNGLHKRKIDNW